MAEKALACCVFLFKGSILAHNYEYGFLPGLPTIEPVASVLAAQMKRPANAIMYRA